MKVSIKNLDAQIELKNKGMELEIRSPDGTFLGDLVVTGTKLIWCSGKTKRQNGQEIKWADFISYANDLTATKKSAKKAAAKKRQK